MPTLLEVVYEDGPGGRPLIWMCSECKQHFDGGTGHPPDDGGVQQINAQFREHCAAEHPGEQAAGIGGAPI